MSDLPTSSELLGAGRGTNFAYHVHILSTAVATSEEIHMLMHRAPGQGLPLYS